MAWDDARSASIGARGRLSTFPLPRRLLNRARLAFRSGAHADAAHYVRDYRRMVQRLMADHPLDEAMSRAVGGDYEVVGAGLADLLQREGLRDGMALFDLGCGSGRLASALGRRLQIGYLGTDVVPELLDYARTRCPADYRFEVNTEPTVPAPDGVLDMACAFSVFTHLLHEETYLYLAEMRRTLKAGGTVVFSFLEFARQGHWSIFDDTVEARRENRRGHLNVFIERPVIEAWCARLGFALVRYDPDRTDGDAGWAGQTIAVLRRL